MPDESNPYRRYLEPETLARISSLELRARHIVEGLMSGTHRSPFQGSSVEFEQHRPYVQGDDIRRLDWKVYAKTGRLYMKQFIEETNLPLMCLVDASESMGFGSIDYDGAPWTKYDHATAIAATLAYLSLRQQDAVGLGVFDQTLSRYFKPSSSPGQWKLVVQELQQVPRWNKTETGKILSQFAEKLSHRSLIVMLSDFFDDLPGIGRGLRQLRYKKHEVIVVQLLDPQEAQFPFDDVTLFRGMEEAGELLTEPRALRKAYLNQLSSFTDELKKLCRGMNIDFAQFQTDEPLDVVLSEFLAERMATIKG